jgi:hypothetical protein
MANIKIIQKIHECNSTEVSLKSCIYYYIGVLARLLSIGLDPLL